MYLQDRIYNENKFLNSVVKYNHYCAAWDFSKCDSKVFWNCGWEIASIESYTDGYVTVLTDGRRYNLRKGDVIESIYVK